MRNHAINFSYMVALLHVMIFSVLSCTDNDTPVPPFIDPLAGLPDKGELNFLAPEVGQRSRFVFFEATYNFETDEVDFDYQGDTLIMAITNKNSDLWIVKEFLTQASKSRESEHSGYWGILADSVFQSELSLDNDSIFFNRDPQDWYIAFAFHAGHKLPLAPVSDQAPENYNALPLFDISNANRWMEFIKNYNHHGKVFPRLNIYFDYTEVASDGLGFTYVYGPSDGAVRMAWVSAWTPNEAAGWDLVPRE